MKVFFCILLFIALLTSCSLLEGSEGDEPPCETVDLIDQRILSAVPYQDGQMLNFEVSDGTGFSATVTRSSFEPTQIGGCVDEVRFDFEGVNVNNSLIVNISLFGDNTEPEFRVDFGVNGSASGELFVVLDDDGRANNNTPNSRVISDTILNGQNFREVVLTEHGGAVDRSYYNTDVGLIGVELSDSTTVFLRD